MIRAADLVGSWRLLACELRGDGAPLLPFGDAPVGYLTYTPSGHMQAAIMAAGRPCFAAPDILRGSVEERARAVEGYLSYAGRYEVNGDRVAHLVEVSLFPNWIGERQERIATLTGDRLALSTDPITIGGITRVARMEWRRLSA
jgi:hypothetical protein